MAVITANQNCTSLCSLQMARCCGDCVASAEAKPGQSNTFIIIQVAEIEPTQVSHAKRQLDENDEDNNPPKKVAKHTLSPSYEPEFNPKLNRVWLTNSKPLQINPFLATSVKSIKYRLYITPFHEHVAYDHIDSGTPCDINCKHRQAVELFYNETLGPRKGLSQAQREVEAGFRKKLMTFVREGVLRAIDTESAASGDARTRVELWHKLFNYPASLMVGGMFPHCSQLSMLALGNKAEWCGPLEELFVFCCERVFENQDLLYKDGEKKGRPQKASLWKKRVLVPCRKAWPKWELPIGEVPTVS